MCMGTDTGGATGVGKMHTDGSVKRQRGANYLCIPAKTISYLNKLRKVQCSGVISRCLPLLSLRIVFEALHLLRVKNESTAGL